MKHFTSRSLSFVASSLVCLALSSPATGQQFEAQQLARAFGAGCVGCTAGDKVEISGDWAFVGVWTHGLLIYRRTSSGWVFHQILRAPTDTAYARSISAEAGTLVVGDFFGESANGENVGKVYVYVLKEGAWVQTHELQPPGLLAFDSFGSSVSLFGNVLAVGAQGIDVTLKSSEVINNSGAVFVYRRASMGEPWELEDRLLSPAASLGGIPGVFGMGFSVALGEDVIAAGAPGDVGAAFLFERDADGWHRSQMLEDPTPRTGDRFGVALAISGNTLVIGESGTHHAGAAFVFEKDAHAPGEWGLVRELRGSDGFAAGGHNDNFGDSLDMEGDHIVVGAGHGDFNGDFTGTAYLFRRKDTGTWPSTETRRLVNSVPGLQELLGWSIALDGNNILVGAIGAYVGDLRPGSAYIFELELGSEYCGAETNSLGLPAHLAITGSEHSSDADMTLSVRDCPPEALGFFLMAPSGDQGLNLTLGEGRLCLGLRGVTRLRPAVSAGPLGILMYDLDSREDVTYPPPGSTWSFQFLYRDPAGGPADFNLTNAVELTLQ